MKTNKIIATLLATAALAAGCQKSQEYADVVFFTGTERSPLTNVYIDGPSSVSVSVSSSRKVETDLQVSIEVDAAALEAYNAEKGTSYVMLPEGSYSLSADAVSIAAGSSVSETLEFKIESMDDFEFGVLYCMPLRITNTSDGTPVLAASQVQYLVLNQLIKTRGVDLQERWYVDMEETMRGKPELDGLSACTMELRIYANAWSKTSLKISSLLGVEENFLLRVGDVSIPGDNAGSILNMAGRGPTLSALKSPLSLKRWYHLAVVDNGSEMKIYVDGVEVASTPSAELKTINLGFYYNSAFAVGMSVNGQRLFNGLVSEARVWKRALSPVELTNNQCYVNPATAKDLLGYWRLDETAEDGVTFNDLSGNGYHGKASRTPVWSEEIHCPVVD